MTLQILNRQNSLLNAFLNEIRNVELQNDRMRFRRNLERVGEIMAYEISKTFSYVPQTIQTPINPAEVNLPAQDVVIATVLRAGLPFHQGFLNYFDRAESAFISGPSCLQPHARNNGSAFRLRLYAPTRRENTTAGRPDVGNRLISGRRIQRAVGARRHTCPYTHCFGHRQPPGNRICRKNINRTIRISMDSSTRR